MVLPLFYLSDLFLIFLTFIGWYYLIFNSYNKFFTDHYDQSLMVALIAWSYLSFEFRTFQVDRRLQIKGTLLRLLTAFLFLTAIYFGYIVLMKYYQLSRLFNFGFIILLYLIINFYTIFRYLFIYYYRSRGGNAVPVIFIASAANTAFSHGQYTSDLQRLGYKMLAILLIDPEYTIHTIKNFLKLHPAEEVFIVDPSNLPMDVDDIVDVCDNLGLRVKLLPGYLKTIGKRMNLDYINGYPIMEVRNEPLLYLHNRFFKRSIDTFFSLLVVVGILSWLTAVLWLLNRIFSPGHVFFKQYRIGRDGKIFIIYKYCTMKHDQSSQKAAYIGAGKKTERNDPRITFIGKFLRKTNLDELPQFINVLKGQMSVVGPRPHMNAEDEQLASQIPKYPVRRFVKPGITGWAQIHGYRGGTENMDMMKRRTDYDIYYLENWNIWLDIKIMAITAWQMLTLRIPNAY